MSELKFISLTGVYIQNFNIVDLVKFLGKRKKTSHSNHRANIDVDIMYTQQPKKKKKKVKNQDSMGKTNFFLSTLPFSLWAVLATWLHIGAPQKIQEKRI
jgi:hypothetical protein